MVNNTIGNKISVEKRVASLIRLGEEINQALESHKKGKNEQLEAIIRQASAENAWFTDKNIITALESWAIALREEDVKKWAEPHLNFFANAASPKKIGVVNAGNIPFVGMHDLLCVFLTGNEYAGKNATGDTVLLPYIASMLCSVEPAFKERMKFVVKLEKIDAVIATGNNNSARYFEYYFGKYPHIIRKNRNSIAILDGSESKEELAEFGRDIFTYFGLGCRNVSKLYVPLKYDFNNFFEAIYDFDEVMSHSKYMNNFDYNNSVLLLKRIPFLQNGFLIVMEDERVASPVSMLHYEKYSDTETLYQKVAKMEEEIQCIVSSKQVFRDNEALDAITVKPGETQSPRLWDYADGVNTIEFLKRAGE